MEKMVGNTPSSRVSGSGRAHSSTRERVLRAVEGGESTTAQIVAATGLHENTVRGHLERLSADGFISRTRIAPTGRGRPAWHWHAVITAEAAYAELAGTLAEAMTHTGSEPATAARAAGVRWGERIARDAGMQPERSADFALAWEQVLVSMARHGFAPEVLAAAGEASSHLLRCPLIAVARGHERIVCTAHEGMIEGIARHFAPGARAALTPLVAPNACAVHLQESP